MVLKKDQSCAKSILPLLAGRRHILFTSFPSPSMAPVTADFGPSSVLIQDQNAPLREHPVPLPIGLSEQPKRRRCLLVVLNHCILTFCEQRATDLRFRGEVLL